MQRQWTPQHYASYMGRADVVRLLLDAGVDLEAKDDVSTTRN